MSRVPIIAGNWKMNLTVTEGLALAAEIRNRCARVRDVEVVLAPVALGIYPIARRLAEGPITVAAQNCHWADQGAYTGELAPPQLKEAGCTYVIVGHSERRAHFGETDEGVGQKARALLDHGLRPILCVGETLDERDAGRDAIRATVGRQLRAAVNRVSAEEAPLAVIAYEPVWAIGTGRTATPEQAQEVHGFLRGLLAERFDATIAGAMRIQYGGSVKPANVVDLMAQPDIDGALVGGASLNADSFAAIVKFRENREDR